MSRHALAWGLVGTGIAVAIGVAVTIARARLTTPADEETAPADEEIAPADEWTSPTGSRSGSPTPQPAA